MSGERENPGSPAVELHIGELTLEGLPVPDPSLLGAAVEQELTRLFEERGTPAALTRDGAFVSLDGGELRTAPMIDAKSIGSQIARAVYGGLSK